MMTSPTNSTKVSERPGRTTEPTPRWRAEQRNACQPLKMPEKGRGEKTFLWQTHVWDQYTEPIFIPRRISENTALLNNDSKWLPEWWPWVNSPCWKQHNVQYVLYEGSQSGSNCHGFLVSSPELRLSLNVRHVEACARVITPGAFLEEMVSDRVYVHVQRCL